MSIYGIVGNTGSGKTTIATAFLLMNDDAEIYANYNIKGIEYTLLENEEDIKNIPRTSNKKIIVIDELHQFGGDSWNYGSLAKTLGRFGTQHRKLHSDVYYTTQHFGQIITRIRNLTKFLFLPRITYMTEDNKPFMAQVFKCNTNIFGDLKILKKFNLPLITSKGTLVVDHFNTDEFIEDMMDPEEFKKNKMIEKYKDYDFCDKEAEKALKSKLILFEHIKPSTAGHIINHIKLNLQNI